MTNFNEFKKTEKTNNELVPHNIEVTRANVITDSVVGFDMTINGVKIYGCVLKSFSDGVAVNFPSRKSDNTNENGKPVYYSHCWCPLSKADKETIYNQILKLVS